jgi:hypothetical protein
MTMNSAVASREADVRRVLCEHWLWPEDSAVRPVTPDEGRFVAVQKNTLYFMGPLVI